MNSQRKYLRHVILYCFKKGDSANDIADEICIVYRNGATTITTIHNWFKRYRAGNFDLKNEDLCGRPATTNTLSKPCSLKIRDTMCKWIVDSH